MRTQIASAAFVCGLAMAMSAAAQPATGGAATLQLKHGEAIRTADGVLVGRIEYVDRAKDGAPKDIAVIHDMRMVHIPIDSLTADPKGYVTTLSKAEVASLR